MIIAEGELLESTEPSLTIQEDPKPRLIRPIHDHPSYQTKICLFLLRHELLKITSSSQI